MQFSNYLQVFFSCGKQKHVPTYNLSSLLAVGGYVGHVMQNAYIMSLEHGENSIDFAHYIDASSILLPFKEKLQKNIESQLVCPFMIFEQATTDIPPYFQRLENIIEFPIINESKNESSFKLTDVHMRLGNKVHADLFYEMSFLFYRTSVANRVSFYILRNILNDLLNLSCDKTIIFYGYASYSQAILVSLQAILQKYFEKCGLNNREVHYAIYQYNLQSELFTFKSEKHEKNSISNNNIQIYSTFEGDTEKTTAIVQIVPIGSTMTTFDKMRNKYIKDKKNEKSELYKNYNVVLVRSNNDEGKKIENDLWVSINSKDRLIEVNTDKMKDLYDNPIISFIMSKRAKWLSPIECVNCFPKDVRNELPLIETDPTSTVPTLQLRQKAKEYSENNHIGNNYRLFQLQDCVYYGHFIRGKNHNQFYIDTQKYIAKKTVKVEIKKWLEHERDKADKIEMENDIYTSPVLNVIFSPEHNTNVGFSQYVNAYYFKGLAEIISVNLDKQFRSNFICEHDAIRQTIERLLNDYEEMSEKKQTTVLNSTLLSGGPVRFYFVDDSIISGGNYYRARSLMQSLIPQKYRNEKYFSVFAKCFILVNRLSLSSLQAYTIMPENNYLSFCIINISNIRKQGDSCVGCKLEDEAKYLFLRSSTRSFANYWAKKSYDHRTLSFSMKILYKYGGTKAYVRLLLCHTLESINKRRSIAREGMKELFEFIVLQKYSEKLLYSDEKEVLEEALRVLAIEFDENLSKIKIIEQIIKMLSRPFFSYNYDNKKFVLQLLINFCEFMFSQKTDDDLVLVFSIIFISDMQSFYFVKDCLFDALSDVNSTYLLRKETIINVYKFTEKYVEYTSDIHCEYRNKKHTLSNCCYIEDTKDNVYPCAGSLVRCFWKKYAFYIHKVIDSGGDEVRALWLEHLLISGTEYNDDTLLVKQGITLPLYESLISLLGTDKKANTYFKEFCLEIFLQNSRLLFDGLEKTKDDTANNSNYNYFLQNVAKMRNLNIKWGNIQSKSYILKSEQELFNFFTREGKEIQTVKDKYKLFINYIHKMITEKYDIVENNLCIALLTQDVNIIPQKMDNLKFIESYIPQSHDLYQLSSTKYIIKQRILQALCTCDKNGMKEDYNDSRLKEDGYFLMCPDAELNINDDNIDYVTDKDSFFQPFFIIRFDNIPIRECVHLGRDAQPIAGVYLYVSFKFQSDAKGKEKVIPLLVMRDILIFRNSIMSILEKDFNSDLMQQDAHKTLVNAIFMHEKTVSHTSTSDDQLPTILWNIDKGNIDKDDYEWLLFRNYTNMKIAKLFNRTLLLFDQNGTETENDNSKQNAVEKQSPKLYINEDNNVQNIFSQPARSLMGDILDETDKRMKLCREIIEIFNVIEKDGKLVTPHCKNSKGYFNKELLKCVIFDIFLSCAKYWHQGADFLYRIENLKEYKKGYEELFVNNKENDYSINYDRLRCKLLLQRQNNYLIIINPINTISNRILNNANTLNKMIKIQLANPFDSFDGHMSLFTIYNYIKNNAGEEPDFEYILFKELPNEWQVNLQNHWEYKLNDESVWFVSKLPIFKKEDYQ